MPPKNTDPNKPKGRTSAYAFFIKHQRAIYKEQGKSLDFSAFAKDCSDEWKHLGPESKEKFGRLAAEDKKRYDHEMKGYVPPAGATKGGRGRKKKDPNAPKRPLSAFLFFCQDRRPAIKAKNPSYTIGNTAKVLGKDWKGLDEEKRKPFEAKAEKDRQRYEQEKRDYVPAGEDDEEEEEDDEYED
ncbi:High mobility group protein DSP1 [Geodia barretti]|uniref:High mobility group protein DSP1 n=1 Tax=Geodia barretti TaxID=519541 RepID=A0AA35T548_GEOBA|nr:High mobility group protein DSP1 [Geodia barretti]